MPYVASKSSALDAAPARRLLLSGGVGLAALAGYVNVVVLGVFAVPVSHMTGAISRLGIDVATRSFTDVALVLLIVAGFFLGAVVSGAIIGSGQLVPGRRYGITLIAEGAALALAAGLLEAGVVAGVAVAALACGIQNGMASSYYGLIIRTTHMTGIVTDLGVLLGQRVRGVHVEAWKPTLLIGLIVGFLFGGVAGQIAYAARGPVALYAPAAGALTGGVVYVVWRLRSRHDPALDARSR